MKLEFEYNEIIAIYKVAKMMADADGVYLNEEKECIVEEMQRLGIENLETIVLDNENLKTLDAFIIIDKFSFESKKYVSAFLGKLMSVDGDIADIELALWRFICQVCNLPIMTNRQALNLMNEL